MKAISWMNKEVIGWKSYTTGIGTLNYSTEYLIELWSWSKNKDACLMVRRDLILLSDRRLAASFIIS